MTSVAAPSPSVVDRFISREIQYKKLDQIILQEVDLESIVKEMTLLAMDRKQDGKTRFLAQKYLLERVYGPVPKMLMTKDMTKTSSASDEDLIKALREKTKELPTENRSNILEGEVIGDE